jgi:two-component sensor histidine kinase/CHASE3 domain sensor protein
MPISTRFVIQSTIVLLAVGFVALLAIVGATIWLNERAQVLSNEAIEARNVRGHAAEFRDLLRTAESSQRGYLVTGNEIYLAPYDSAKSLALRQLGALTGALNGLPDVKAMLDRLTVVAEEKFREMDETVALKSARRDAEALAIFRTNRGKALMDEANVFLSGIINDANDRLTESVAEQRANATMLRWVSIVGGVVIMFVVGVTIATIGRYTMEIKAARDDVRSANAHLEDRVSTRTAELARARDRAEVLLAEVNHRVANSLALVGSLVQLQSRAVRDQAAKDALRETQARINAIALVHKRLYTSGDVRYVALDEYLSTLLEHLQTSMHAEGHGASLKYELEPLSLPTDASINLGVVVTEWVTNAFKYAYPDRSGEVRVSLKSSSDGQAELSVEDKGVGRVSGGASQGTGLGTRIVNAVAATMGAEIEYTSRQPGTRARLKFPVRAAA